MFGGEKEEKREEVSKDSNILMVPAGSHPPPASPTPSPLHSTDWGWKSQSVSNNCHLYQFARATLSKYHKLGGLNNRNLLSHSSGSGRSEQGAGKVGSCWIQILVLNK